MKGAISYFCKQNKLLSILSIIAVVIILFYYFTYNLLELWYNAHVLVDILFQLSLAVIANLTFYIFQVHIPAQKSKMAMRPIIEQKIDLICSYIESPFADIVNLYLEYYKEIDKLTDAEMRKILLNYKSTDYLTYWKTAGEFKPYTLGEHVQHSFDGIKQTIDELLIVYDSYLDEEEKLALIQLNVDDFYILLISPFTALEGVTRIIDEKEINEFKSFQQKYTKMKKMITYNGEANNG